MPARVWGDGWGMEEGEGMGVTGREGDGEADGERLLVVGWVRVPKDGNKRVVGRVVHAYRRNQTNKQTNKQTTVHQAVRVTGAIGWSSAANTLVRAAAFACACVSAEFVRATSVRA